MPLMPVSLFSPRALEVLQHFQQQNTQAHFYNEFGDPSLFVCVIKPPLILSGQDVAIYDCCQDQPTASWFAEGS